MRSITFDGERPKVDADTGYDVDPDGYLIDPASGVRLAEVGGGLQPVDPFTGEPLSVDGHDLAYDPIDGTLYDPITAKPYEVDYTSGRLLER